MRRVLLPFLVIVALGGFSGCETMGSKKKKEASTIRFHLEINPDGTDRSNSIRISRELPFSVNIERSPFLDEAHVDRASVVDVMGGFQIFLQFNRQGSWMLEQYSTASKGKRVAIFSQFGQDRWLAAPLLQQRISNGVFAFTPDATREEAERIVRGLNNVATERRKKNPSDSW